MNHIRTELLRDPLFQLNIILWLTQPMPPQGSITPLLHQKGFSVYAIAPTLSVPPGIALAVQRSSLQTQQRVRPDVVLKSETDLKFVLVVPRYIRFCAFWPGMVSCATWENIHISN